MMQASLVSRALNMEEDCLRLVGLLQRQPSGFRAPSSTQTKLGKLQRTVSWFLGLKSATLLTPWDDALGLTLNVMKPDNATPDSKLPVLVWIYGGGFSSGSTNMYVALQDGDPGADAVSDTTAAL